MLCVDAQAIFCFSPPDNLKILAPIPVVKPSFLYSIADDVVECEKARIFAQMTNGVYIRMALLYMALENK